MANGCDAGKHRESKVTRRISACHSAYSRSICHSQAVVSDGRQNRPAAFCERLFLLDAGAENADKEAVPTEPGPLALSGQFVAGSYEQFEGDAVLVAIAEEFLVDDGQQSVLYGKGLLSYFVQKHDIGCGQIAVDGTFILVGFFQSANADRTENLVGRRSGTSGIQRHEHL